MERIKEIDAFRGIAIVLMVFFTLTRILSENLPDVLKHNVEWELHFGDFVLPMFLFASGMSLVFFFRKHSAKGGKEFALDIVERFGLLVIVSFMLSIFTVGEAFGMDVIMLSALLFLATMILITVKQEHILVLMAAISLLYFVLMELGTYPVFPDKHLGGYPAALYYFPVMLAGMLVGREIRKKSAEGMKRLAIVFLALFIVSALLMPVDKMSASPAFMALSIIVSMALFSACSLLAKRGVELKEMQWLGRKPLRYWVLMFIVFIIPLIYYAYFTGQTFPLQIDWPAGIAITMSVMLLLAAVSWLIDRAMGIAKRMKTPGRKR